MSAPQDALPQLIGVPEVTKSDVGLATRDVHFSVISHNFDIFHRTLLNGIWQNEDNFV